MKKNRRPISKPQVVKNIPAVSAAAPTAGTKEELVIQFGENEVAADHIFAKVREHFKQSGHEEKIAQVKVYVKPEDNKAYYVVNDEIHSDVDLV